jgi:hypothetical protein
MDFFLAVNERDSVGDISHDTPNTIDLKVRSLNILFKTFVAELHIDKIVRVNDTQAENCNDVLVAVAAQFPNCTLLVFDSFSSDGSERFCQFSCESLSVILNNKRRNTIAVVVLRICNN